MTKTFTIDQARELDRVDPLAAWRKRFHIPPGPDGAPSIYLCGNSLGLQPDTTRQMIEEELDDWARLGVLGHESARRPWMPYHERLTELTARLVGAEPLEVVQMNTLTVNLHLMMVSFYRPTRERHKLLIEAPAFPSDRYAAESQVRFHGFDPAESLVEIGPREGESVIRDRDLAELIEREGDEIALVMLPGVQYYSGQVFDLEGVTRLARERGCAVGFDLAHAVGNVPLRLHDWGPDFAVWCNYKYVNAGPGAVGGCFVHERHAERFDLPRFAGWWGHDKKTRFQMGPEFHPMAGAEGWQLSNPPILSLAPVLSSLDMFDEAGMDALRDKSLKLTDFLLEGIDGLGARVEVLTPREPARRGCQLSLRLTSGDGRAVFGRLQEAGVICDWREPAVIRVAPVPLYNRFEDVYRFVQTLGEAAS
jgi:kynureninase